MISEIIRNLVKKYGMNPYDINNGRCEEFAMDVIDEMEDRRVAGDVAGYWGDELPDFFAPDLCMQHYFLC